MKRLFTILPLLLAALMLSAQTSVTVDGIKYTLDGSNATVTYPTDGEPGSSNPNTYTGDIVIPPSINVDGTDYSVTAIGKKAFRSSTITAISLPEGLLSIGEEAICKTNITEIIVPNSVTTLGKYAIGQNSSLQTITFGQHVADNTWGKWVAWRSSGGYEVYMICDAMPVLPDEYTFDDTHASTIFVKPALYNDYVADQYWGMYNIVKMGTELIDFTVDGIKYKMITEDKVIVTYPTETKPGSSNPNPYTGDFVVPDKVTYEGQTFNVTGIGDFAFRYATITSLSLPEGIVSIGEEAIYNTKITELTLPNSLITMGTYAMAYNANLEKVTFGENIATEDWGAWVLYRESPEYDIYMDCHAKPTVPDKYTFDHGYQSRIHVYPDVYEDFLNDEYWGGKYTIIADMGGSSIEYLSFVVDGIKYKMTAEDKVSVIYPTEEKPGSSNPNPYTGDIVIPAQVTYEGVTYNVTSIGNYAFRSSTITSISLPEGLISIGKEAIYKTEITEIVVPNSVTNLGESCISENPNLQNLTFGEHIADNKWGVWVAWRTSGGYNVYMICDVMPKLPDNQTFDDTHESIIHVYPSVYLDYIADEYWNCHTIVADLLQEISPEDLLGYIATYSALLPTEDEVGIDPGFYTAASVQALNEALAYASSLDESSTMQERNQALLQMIVAADGLKINPLNEGYYYIENVYTSSSGNKYMRTSSDGYIVTKSSIDETDARYFFKLIHKGSNWYIQSADDNKKYFGAPDSEGWMTLTDNPDYEQIITWIGGGKFKLQCLNEGTASNPYTQSSGYVFAKNYSDDDAHIQWRFHPAQSGKFPMDFNIENIRVREFMAEVTYTAEDATKITPYNVAPPTRRDLPEPATIFWTQNTTATAQQITWSLNPDFSDAFTAEVNLGDSYYEIFNLLPNQTYYYKVTLTVDGNPTEVINSTFTTSGQLRQIKGEGAANMRDLGGWATASGTPIKYGLIYRGAEWNGKYNLTPEGIAAIRAVGMKAELDLRSSNEALYIDKSPLGDDVTYIRIHNEDYYESGLQNRKDLYKRNLDYVFDCVKNDKPVYFHCHIGADRTGTLAILLEGLLGVSESDMYKDYELTTFSLYETHRYKENVDGIMTYIKSLSGETLTDKFYTYCHDELGLSAKEIADFRMKMLGTVYDVDVKNVVSEAVSTNETYLDLTDYNFEAEALTGNMPAEGNLVVAVSPESGITGQNIINDGVCESLVLTDGIDYGTPIAFVATQVSFTSNVSLYKTLVLPFEADVPAGFTASEATSVYGAKVILEEVSTIRANAPVIVQGEGVFQITANNAEVAASEGITPQEGVLYGTYKSTLAPHGSYVLQNQDDVIGFYHVEDEITVKAFRSYLEAPASSVKAFYLNNDATGIASSLGETQEEAVFNLAGQRLSKPQKGINIIKNKKYIK
ncbi:MAG: leucine-rich repeat protein [Bacteroidaceae bacterium]|nr:leucine-rich repeat protein [Bacteroidaceae bacterium]